MIKSVNNVNTFLAWDSSTYVAAAISNFTAQISGLYNMPMCNPIGQSASEIQKQQSDSSQAQIEQQSATIFSKNLNATKEVISLDTVAKTVTSLMNDLLSAAQNTANQGTPATNSLLVGKVLYQGTSLYQTRILNNASRLLDYLNDVLINGNLTQAQYDIYFNQLQTVLNYPSIGFVTVVLP